MTSAIFYISSIVFSITGIFALWQLGLKKLMLDDFRDSLFVTRDRLYLLAKQGKISCDSPAYRAVELFINRTIRYAHRFSFLSFAFTMWHIDKVREAASHNTQSSSLLRTVEAVKDQEVRAQLVDIMQEVTVLLPRYIAKSSLMFMCAGLIYVVFRSVSPFVAKSKQKAVETFEMEACRDDNFGNYASA